MGTGQEGLGQKTGYQKKNQLVKNEKAQVHVGKVLQGSRKSDAWGGKGERALGGNKFHSMGILTREKSWVSREMGRGGKYQRKQKRGKGKGVVNEAWADKKAIRDLHHKLAELLERKEDRFAYWL